MTLVQGTLALRYIRIPTANAQRLNRLTGKLEARTDVYPYNGFDAEKPVCAMAGGLRALEDTE